MTISVAVLTSGVDLIDRTTYTTASISPAADKLILAIINGLRGGGANNDGNASVSGCGITWSLAAGVLWGGSADNDGWIGIYRGHSASPSAGALSLAFNGLIQANCLWSIVEFTGVDLAQGDEGVIQAVAAMASSGMTAAATLAAFGSATNATVAAGGVNASGPPTLTEEGGYTVIGGGSAGQLVLKAAFLASQDISPSMTISSSLQWGFVGVELAELVSGGPSPHHHRLLLMGVGS